LVIGLYSDFGTDWAYPSIRTIARQAGLSRQTVLTAIQQLSEIGILATSKAKGRSTAYRIIRQAPQRPPHRHTSSRSQKIREPKAPGLESLEDPLKTGQNSLDEVAPSGPKVGPVPVQPIELGGPKAGPKRDSSSKDETASIPIPGTPFRLTAEGRLQVAVDLQELLTNQGIPPDLAERLTAQKDPEAVAKVLLNALYLQSQGKLQNGPGYIRAGIEDGYDLLPQVATRLEVRRRELEDQRRKIEAQRRLVHDNRTQLAEQAAISYVLEQLGPEQLDCLLKQALSLLPEPIVKRNPTLSNPFVRGKVYELACGEPAK
jgi:biotin operon repressor